jgi:hypothetical protein
MRNILRHVNVVFDQSDGKAFLLQSAVFDFNRITFRRSQDKAYFQIGAF